VLQATTKTSGSNKRAGNAGNKYKVEAADSRKVLESVSPLYNSLINIALSIEMLLTLCRLKEIRRNEMQANATLNLTWRRSQDPSVLKTKRRLIMMLGWKSM